MSLPWKPSAAPAKSSFTGQVPNPPGVNQKLVAFKSKKSGTAVASKAPENPMDDPLAALGIAPKSIRVKRAWEMAISPAKSLPMNAFMLYMSGSGVQIFSMGTIFMLLSNPIKAVTNIKRTFQPFQPAPTSQEPAELMMPQIVFVLCQCLTLALGLWKCNQMGIIPRGAADWLAFESRNPAPETLFFSSLAQ